MKNPLSCFVTGTDTEIGKTLVSGALLRIFSERGFRAAAMKPVAAGAEWRDGQWRNDDVELLGAHATVDLPISVTCPYLLRTAAAPHIAARLEDVVIEMTQIKACYEQICAQSDVVVVEGVGGFRVPLNEEFDTADLAGQLALSVVLVVGMRLGCINQTLVTAEAIAARGLQCVGWVANCNTAPMPFLTENIEALATRMSAPLLGVIPHLDEPNPHNAMRYLKIPASWA